MGRKKPDTKMDLVNTRLAYGAVLITTALLRWTAYLGSK